MLELNAQTARLIDKELQSVPERYQKPFNSMHEALGIIREEYKELEDEIFFGEKRVRHEFDFLMPSGEEQQAKINNLWRDRVKKEAVQVAAMCARLIQEL